MTKERITKGKTRPAETALYAPIKAFLEAQGFEVKSEVRGCDVIAIRDDEPWVVVELKTSFTLGLVLQGVDRFTITDQVYVAVPSDANPELFRKRRKLAHTLCRRLGLGLLKVDLAAPASAGAVSVEIEPLPYQPRKNTRRTKRLKREFDRMVGDPNLGGSRGGARVTAYRQMATRIGHALAGPEPVTLADVRATTGIQDCAKILQRNVYGWFDRVERGVYTLSDQGRAALTATAPPSSETKTK